MVQNMIIERKVIAWDDINARVLLNLPMFETKALALSEEVCLRKFTAPVGFGGFLEVPQDTHARETEDRSMEDMSGADRFHEGRLTHDWTILL